MKKRFSPRQVGRHRGPPALVAPLEVLVEPCYLNSPANLGRVAKDGEVCLALHERIIEKPSKTLPMVYIYSYYVYRERKYTKYNLRYTDIYMYIQIYIVYT